jgi:hypothetical protein
MARRQNIPSFRETGKLAEEFLGGNSVKPKNNPKLAESMYDKGELLSKRFAKNPHFETQIEHLKEGLIKLLTLADQHEETVNPSQQQKIRNSMWRIKKYFNHDLLREALIRYTINAHPKQYTPWEPGPIRRPLPRNEFITDLQEHVCEELNTTDYNKVRFYNASGTPLDILYSTDGFFTLDGSLFPDRESRILPIDITLSKSKELKEFNPSGSLILFMDSDKLDDEGFKHYQENFAGRIKDVLENTKPDHALDGFISKFDEEELSA